MSKRKTPKTSSRLKPVIPNLDGKPKRQSYQAASEEDKALWNALTEQVKPLKQKKLADKPLALVRPAKPSLEEADFAETMTSMADFRGSAAQIQRRRDFSPLPPAFPAPTLAKKSDYLAHGDAPGLDKRKKRRMQRGKLEIDARLDLHGMSQDQAQMAVQGFVARCYDQGRRSLIIVSGKGLSKQSGGVLRTRLPDWLNMAPIREKVLSFDYTQPKDGGTGAIYVLLKKKKA